MTMDNTSEFHGLMASLNLDITNYDIHQDLNYSQLAIVKDNIESQLSQLFDVLTRKYHADMNTSLLTADGFPREDIDVVSIRLIRVNIIRLRNDHKYLLTLLEAKLIEQFQNAEPETVEYTIPFAVIDEVIANSPAEASGMHKGDKIVTFDKSIHAGNHNKLSAVVRRVQTNIDMPLKVEVIRNGSKVELELTPTNQWEGKGALGCKIVPI